MTLITRTLKQVAFLFYLCPSCLHTTTAFRSFQPESQILPQSPWRYTSTRPSFLLLLPPTRRTRGPDSKHTQTPHSYSCGRIYAPRSRSYMSADSVKMSSAALAVYSHSNGLRVYRRRRSSAAMRRQTRRYSLRCRHVAFKLASDVHLCSHRGNDTGQQRETEEEIDR